MREIVEAARAEGLRVGFYHSVIDWHHDQYEYAHSKQLPHPLKGKPYPNGVRDHSRYVDDLHAQVTELVSNYGTAASPFANLRWGRCTRKPGILYLHVSVRDKNIHKKHENDG